MRVLFVLQQNLGDLISVDTSFRRIQIFMISGNPVLVRRVSLSFIVMGCGGVSCDVVPSNSELQSRFHCVRQHHSNGNGGNTCITLSRAITGLAEKIQKVVIWGESRYLGKLLASQVF